MGYHFVFSWQLASRQVSDEKQIATLVSHHNIRICTADIN